MTYPCAPWARRQAHTKRVHTRANRHKHSDAKRGRRPAPTATVAHAQPTAHSPQPTAQPTAHSPQPTAHSPQPTAHSPQPAATHMLRTITRPAGRPGELSSVHHHQPVRRYRRRGRGQLGFLHTRHTSEPTPTRQSRRRCTPAAGSGSGSGASARAIAYLWWHEVQHISAGRDGADVNQGLQRILTAPPHSPQRGALDELHRADTEDGSLPASVFSPFALPDSQRLWTIRSTTSVRGGA